MKLLLDESVPRRLAAYSPKSFTLQTVQEMGWAGTGNGLLLALAANQEFDALVTVDLGIEHQQNMGELPIAVIVMLAHRNRLPDLEPLVSDVTEVLGVTLEKAVYRVVPKPETRG